MQYLRKHVRVLVRVEMGHLDPCGLQFANLRSRFGFDLIGMNTIAQGESNECGEAAMKVRCAGFHQVRNLVGREQGLSVDQYYVTANSESWRGLSQMQGIVECGRIGHHGSGGDDAVGVSLNDGAIHAQSEAEIIRINNEPSQCASVAGDVEGKSRSGFGLECLAQR